MTVSGGKGASFEPMAWSNGRPQTREHTCAVCTQPTNTPDICLPCESRITNNLQRIRTNYETSADPTLTPRTQIPRQPNPNQIPGGTDWLNYRQGADGVRTLTQIASEWATTYNLNQPPATIPALCDWIRNHLRKALTHPDINSAADHIHQLAATSDRYAGRAAPTHARLKCPALTPTQQECGAPIHLESGLDLHAPIRCRTCGATWTRIQLEHIAINSKTSDAWVDPEVAARVTGVDGSTLRRWARNGQVARNRGLYQLKTLHAA